MKNKIPKLTVVGAGPGDPDLVTLKAVKAIKSADVILYDALINSDLLNYASEKTEKIYVGKRKGCYVYQQDQINELIVSRAKSFGHVVRLKGGDPFIFGRGAEEIEYAQQFGLETQIVSGISSAFAVPAYQNIPLTKRGSSESFWVLTGTTKNHKISKDIALAAQSNATIVILMGMNNLDKIIEQFQHYNRDELPVAIIQNGTTPNEKIGVGTVQNIQQIVQEKKLTNPAVIILGNVVRHRTNLLQLQQQILMETALC